MSTIENSVLANVSPAQLAAEKAEFEKIVQNTAKGLDPDAKKALAVITRKNREDAKRDAEGRSVPVKGKARKGAPAKKGTKSPVKVKRASKLKGTGAGIKALELAKVRYREAGHPSHCGDWLATTLQTAFLSKEKGKKAVFDLEAFLDCCTRNDLDITEKWATNRAPGWQGRLRMNGRQKLETVVARQGFIYIAKGKKETPPKVFIKLMQEEHPEKPEPKDPAGDDE